MRNYNIKSISVRKFYLIVILAILLSAFLIYSLQIIFELDNSVLILIIILLSVIFIEILKRKIINIISIKIENEKMLIGDLTIYFDNIISYEKKLGLSSFGRIKLYLKNRESIKLVTRDKYGDFLGFIDEFEEKFSLWRTP